MKNHPLPGPGDFFRRTFLVRLAISAVAFAGSSDLPAQNFPNGGFEEGSSGWPAWPAGASIATGTFAQSGTQAAQLQTTGPTLVIERDLNLLPGLNVTVSGYLRAVSTSGTGRTAQAELVIVSNGSEQAILLGKQTTNNAAYQQYTVNRWIPLGTTSTKLRLTASGTTTAVFDSYSVKYTTGKQLIDDRGFEKFTAATYFSGTNTISWKSTAGCVVTGSTPHGGLNAAEITPSTGNRFVSQDFPLAPGQTITIRGYVKTVTSGTFESGILLKCFNSGGTPSQSDTTLGQVSGTSGYTKIEKTIAISGTSSTVRGQIRLFANGGTGSGGKVHFDDISVTEGDGTTKAFPGAEGFGAATPGGRGPAGTPDSDIVIYRVTDLMGASTGTINSVLGTGTGSLRYVLERPDSKKYYVLFGKEGIIDSTVYNIATGLPKSTDMMVVTQPHKTIAGQTAPGVGVTMRNAGIRVKTTDIVLRGMRFRPGGLHCFSGTHPADLTPEARSTYKDLYLNESARDCLAFDQSDTKVANCIVDHCSLAWSTDEQVQFYVYGGLTDQFSDVPIENITFSNNLLTEPLDSPWHLEFDDNDKHHAYQMSLSWVKNFSLFRNIFAHGQRRQPEARDGCELEMVNNIIYNYETIATQFYGMTGSGTPLTTKALVIGNRFVVGPNLGMNPDTGTFPNNLPHGIDFNASKPPNAGSKFYLWDNYGFYRTNSGQDEWTETDYPASWFSGTVNPFRAWEPEEAMAASDVARVASVELLDRLLLTGSFSSRQNRPGAYPHDALDLRTISDILTHSGTGGQPIPYPLGSLIPNGSQTQLVPDRQYSSATNEGPKALAGKKNPPQLGHNWDEIENRYRLQDEYGNGNGRQYDDWDNSTFHHYGGYLFTSALAPNAASKIRLYDHNFNASGRSLMLKEDGYAPVAAYSGSGSYGFVAGRTYTGTLSVERTSTSAVTASVTFSGSLANGAGSSWTFVQSDTTAPTYAFDAIAFFVRSGTGVSAMNIGNIEVSKGATQYLNETFGDGNRTGQSPPTSADWFASRASGLSVAGNTLSIEPTCTALAYFTAGGTPVDLAVGESIVATFTIQISGSSLPSTNDFLRVALLNSHGTPTDHNGVPIAPEVNKVAVRVNSDGYDPLPDDDSNGIPNDWEDTNGNGLPDVWEANYAGELGAGATVDPRAVSADGEGGYLNVEIYANSFIPPNDK